MYLLPQLMVIDVPKTDIRSSNLDGRHRSQAKVSQQCAAKAELRTRIDEYVRKEALSHQALALGMDTEDYITRWQLSAGNRGGEA